MKTPAREQYWKMLSFVLEKYKNFTKYYETENHEFLAEFSFCSLLE